MSNQLEIVEAQALKLYGRGTGAARGSADYQPLRRPRNRECLGGRGRAPHRGNRERSRQVNSGGRLHRPGPRRDQMTPSVGSEADWELTEGALFYAREANTAVGLALAGASVNPGVWAS